MTESKPARTEPRKGDRVRFTSGRHRGELGTVTRVVDMAPGRSWHVRVDGHSGALPGNAPHFNIEVAS
jgi:hypothetical protein